MCVHKTRCRVQNTHTRVAYNRYGLSLHLVAVQETAPQPTHTALLPLPTPHPCFPNAEIFDYKPIRLLKQMDSSLLTCSICSL